MFNYEWTLKDANFTKDKGKVFSCFACGGGSTMGYKLAGYDVIGALDIDPKMMEVYRENHKPKYSFVESITTFKDRDDLPEELFDLDILDGSPPCSSFSMAGNRDKDWGKKKKFREGQAEQVLDTLFFDFIDLAKRLQPKIVVAENVKGIIQGSAKEYVKKIYSDLEDAGYYVQHFLLDASKMGVPQKRERVFFVAIRKDISEPFLEQIDMFLSRPNLKLSFNGEPITFGDIYKEADEADRPLNEGTEMLRLWHLRHESDSSMEDAAIRDLGIKKFFSARYLKFNEVSYTLPAHDDSSILMDEPRRPNKRECSLIGSFPLDYNFMGMKYNYIIGMSVPPLMTANLSLEIYNQWLSKV